MWLAARLLVRRASWGRIAAFVRRRGLNAHALQPRPDPLLLLAGMAIAWRPQDIRHLCRGSPSREASRRPGRAMGRPQRHGVRGLVGGGADGVQAAARAYKRPRRRGPGSWPAPFRSLVGRSALRAVVPSAAPIVFDQWNWVWARYAALSVGTDASAADSRLQEESFAQILSRRRGWPCGPRCGRHRYGPSARPAPPFSQEFGIENMFWPQAEKGTLGPLPDCGPALGACGPGGMVGGMAFWRMGRVPPLPRARFVPGWILSPSWLRIFRPTISSAMPPRSIRGSRSLAAWGWMRFASLHLRRLVVVRRIAAAFFGRWPGPLPHPLFLWRNRCRRLKLHSTMRIAFVLGTRPEIIKTAPLVFGVRAAGDRF